MAHTATLPSSVHSWNYLAGTAKQIVDGVSRLLSDVHITHLTGEAALEQFKASRPDVPKVT